MAQVTALKLPKARTNYLKDGKNILSYNGGS